MKKITKKAIVAAVKKEYAEARRWCRGGWGRYYKMMIDTDNGSIWSDTFLSENSWKEYHSNSITSLEYVPGYVVETEQGYIDSAIKLLTAAGWKVED